MTKLTAWKPLRTKHRGQETGLTAHKNKDGNEEQAQKSVLTKK